MKYLILINLLLASFISNAQQKQEKLKLHLDTVNVDGRAGVAITINEMPGQKFVLEIPEILWFRKLEMDYIITVNRFGIWKTMKPKWF